MATGPKNYSLLDRTGTFDILLGVADDNLFQVRIQEVVRGRELDLVADALAVQVKLEDSRLNLQPVEKASRQE
jgi:hypothetical protein